MATDIERLIVSLEASTTKYERALAKANGETDKRVRAMQSRFDGLGAGIANTQTRIAGSLAGIGRAFGVLGIALTTTSIIAMTSAWTDLNSRITNAAGSVEKGAAVLDQLSVMARRTYSSLNQTAESYLNNSQALTALGYSTQQQLDLTEALNNSLVISATRGQAAQSVMDAWSKAMAGGSLRGENLNTIIQKGGRLSKALADSMGISVNELRKMGEQGKITTDVMYGVTGQLETLRAEADAMPATVSDGFTLLQNAVLRFVGQADAAIGSSNALAEALVAIADAINNMPDENWFDQIFKQLGDDVAKTIATTRKEIDGIGEALGVLKTAMGGQAFTPFTKAEMGALAAASAAKSAAAEMEAFAIGASGVYSPEVEEAFRDLIVQLEEGRGSAETAKTAILALGAADPSFEKVIDRVLSLVTHFIALRDAANAANAAAANTTSDLGEFPTKRAFNKEFGPDLTNDGAPGGPIRPPAGGSKGKSPTEKFNEDLTQYARKIEMLKQETALTAALNPLLNDYGYAKERLKAVQELENAATKAGLALDPDRRASIAKLAEGYAQATVEAKKLAEAQGATVRQMEDLRDASRQALDTIIDGFLEGKDAGEIFGNVLKDIGKQLISMGLNSLFGGGSGGGFGLLGQLFGIKAATGGQVRGPGSGTSDSIPARLSDGEFVVNAKAAGQNLDLLHAINSGKMSGFKDGGIVGMPSMPSIPRLAPANDSGGVNVTFAPNVTMTDGSPESIARLERSMGKMQAEFEGRVKLIIVGRGKRWVGR